MLDNTISLQCLRAPCNRVMVPLCWLHRVLLLLKRHFRHEEYELGFMLYFCLNGIYPSIYLFLQSLTHQVRTSDKNANSATCRIT